MATLYNAHGASLAPDPTEALRMLIGGFAARQQRQDRQVEKDAGAQKQADIQMALQNLFQGRQERQGQEPTQEDVAEETGRLSTLAALNPTLAKTMSELLKSGDEQQMEAVGREVENGVRLAKQLKDAPDFVSRKKVLSEIGRQYSVEDKPLDRIVHLSNMTEGQLDTEIDRMMLAGQEVKDLLAPVKSTFGQPIRALGPDGNPTFVQVDKDGNVRAMQGYAPIPNGMKLESDGEGGFTLTTGDQVSSTQPLTTATTNMLQKSLASLEETSARISDLDQRYNREFLTYSGQISSKISEIKDKANIDLSEEDRQFLKDRTKFTTLVNREFNAYRKEITGAAASVQELESLKKATISEDQSPAQFEANLEVYQEELQRAMRIKRRLLREGIAVDAKEFGGRFDDIYLGGGDDDETARYGELSAQGLSEDEVLAKMVSEGY
jgi:hypothetical protein